MKRNGVYEWIYQRCSQLAIAVFTIVYLSLILTMEDYNYMAWKNLHQALWFKIYATVTLCIVMLNALLAGWQIGTDYTQKVPLPGFKQIFHGSYLLGSACFLGFGLYILWLM